MSKKTSIWQYLLANLVKVLSRRLKSCKVNVCNILKSLSFWHGSKSQLNWIAHACLTKGIHTLSLWIAFRFQHQRCEITELQFEVHTYLTQIQNPGSSSRKKMEMEPILAMTSVCVLLHPVAYAILHKAVTTAAFSSNKHWWRSSNNLTARYKHLQSERCRNPSLTSESV